MAFHGIFFLSPFRLSYPGLYIRLHKMNVLLVFLGHREREIYDQAVDSSSSQVDIPGLPVDINSPWIATENTTRKPRKSNQNKNPKSN